jgi:cell division protease FtsH
MSENVGQVYYARKSRSRFLATEPEGAGEYSEATAESIDQRVKEIIAQQYKRAMEIVITKRPGLEKGAQMLLEQEKNEAAEIKTLMEAA